MLVLGFTGTFAAGKDTAISIIAKRFGAQAFEVSTSDLVREETARRGLSLERENLRIVSNDMRKKHGVGVFGKITVEKIKANPQKQVFLVSGIRTPGEVEALRNAFNEHFKLIAVDAPIETRYNRIKQRSRANEEFMSFEQFKQSEESEMKGAAYSQNIAQTMKLADVTLVNDGSTSELEKKIEEILKKFN